MDLPDCNGARTNSDLYAAERHRWLDKAALLLGYGLDSDRDFGESAHVDPLLALHRSGYTPHQAVAQYRQSHRAAAAV